MARAGSEADAACRRPTLPTARASAGSVGRLGTPPAPPRPATHTHTDPHWHEPRRLSDASTLLTRRRRSARGRYVSLQEGRVYGVRRPGRVAGRGHATGTPSRRGGATSHSRRARSHSTYAPPLRASLYPDYCTGLRVHRGMPDFDLSLIKYKRKHAPDMSSSNKYRGPMTLS